VTYRIILSDLVLLQLHGFPFRARDALIAGLVPVCEDPHNIMHSSPVGDGEDPSKRWVLFDGSAGFARLTVDDEAQTVTVEDLNWAG
jgi:hypothetical protein